MGINTGGGTETVDRFLDSTLESVDSAEGLAIEIAQKAGINEDDLAKISMAVRESMVNAVVHGNQYSAHKKVRLSVSKSAGRFTVTIADEGNGFDPDNTAGSAGGREPDAQLRPRYLSHSCVHG